MSPSLASERTVQERVCGRQRRRGRNDPLSENASSQRLIAPRTTPPIRGFSRGDRNSSVAKDCVVGPGVVPWHSDFNNLDCQTGLSRNMGTKSKFLRCKTKTVSETLYANLNTEYAATAGGIRNLCQWPVLTRLSHARTRP
jgi:hypothetical protein